MRASSPGPASSTVDATRIAARRPAPLMKFIFGEPMKPATNMIVGIVVELERPADLLDVAGAQHHDPVGERHRLDLVVGDVDHRGAELLVQPRDLDAHLDAQFGVEIGERLVEQEHLRLAHDGAADGDALALAAGQLLRARGPSAGSSSQDVGGAASTRSVDLGLRHCRSCAGRSPCSRSRVMCG